MESFKKLGTEEQAAIMLAVDSLCKDNPGVVRQLQKLAALRLEKPKTWAAGLKFLKIS